MECDICANHISGEPGLHCPACARNILYPLRVQYATTLLSKGSLSRQVEAVVSGAKVGGETSVEPAKKSAEKLAHTSFLEEAQETQRRLDRIMEQNDILRTRIESYKKQVADQKAATTRQRQDLAKAKEQLKYTKATSIEPVEKSINSLATRHAKVYRHIVTARGYLCKQAAILANLQEVSATHNEDPPSRSIHTIAGLPLIDLRDLNHANPKELSAAINNAIHLVSNACHYLGIRLPAELVLPSRDRPIPSVFSIPSSYLALNDQERSVMLQYHHHPSSLSASRQLESRRDAAKRTNLPRPRPLFLDKKLSQIAREDSALYSLQVEGLALFAWDIAWLCRTQGVLVAEENWEGICAIGQNLWSLFMVASSQNRSSPAPTQPHLPLKGDSAQRSSPSNTATKPAAAGPEFGVLSHATTHTFLRSAYSSTTATEDASSSASSWKHASPTEFIDKLKATLLNDMSGLEWELLDDESGGPEDGRTVTQNNAVAAAVADGEVQRGVVAGSGSGSGWTKLKSRNTSVSGSGA